VRGTDVRTMHYKRDFLLKQALQAFNVKYSRTEYLKTIKFLQRANQTVEMFGFYFVLSVK